MSAFMDAIKPRGKYLSLSKLANVGDSYTIQITDKYTERQQTDYATKEPIFSKKSGKPVTELLIPGLNYDAESEEDAPSILVIDKWRARQAVGHALKAADVNDLAEGGVLTITYKGLGLKAEGAIAAPKDFEASYTPPAPTGDVWGGEDEG